MSREAIQKVSVRDVHSVSATRIAETSDYFFIFLKEWELKMLSSEDCANLVGDIKFSYLK